MKFYVIGDKDTVTGFSLAGIQGINANSKAEALEALRYALDSKDIGIILITESLAAMIHKTIDEILCNRKICHLIFKLPDLNGTLKGRDSVEDFVLSALGVRV